MYSRTFNVARAISSGRLFADRVKFSQVENHTVAHEREDASLFTNNNYFPPIFLFILPITLFN